MTKADPLSIFIFSLLVMLWVSIGCDVQNIEQTPSITPTPTLTPTITTTATATPIGITFIRAYGLSHTESASSVVQTFDQGYLLCGYDHYLVDYPYESSFGTYIVRVDQLGNELWERRYMGLQFNYNSLNAICRTEEDLYMLCGYRELNSSVERIWVLKIDDNGSEIWSKTYDTGVSFSIQNTADGNFVICGTYNPLVYPDMPNKSLLLKIDSEGKEIWSQKIKLGNKDAYGLSVKQCSDQGFIISGCTVKSSLYHPYLIKTDHNGYVEWAVTYEEYSGTSSEVLITENGEFLMCGSLYLEDNTTKILLIKTDTMGKEIWNKIYAINETANVNSACKTDDNKIIICGYTKAMSPDYNVFILKVDNQGNELWLKIYGGYDSDFGNSIQITSDDGFAIGGSTRSFGAIQPDFLLIKTDKFGNVAY